MRRWRAGEVILRREVLNDGRAWMETPVIVVRDEPELLATYIATGAPFRFPPGQWPTANGRHPWAGKERWHGHGALMLQRPGEAHAIWVFWQGAQREFRGWYVNLQEPFRGTAHGYDTQDLELDIWVPVDGPLEWKDEQLLEQRVREGRFTAEQAAATRAEGRRVAAELDAGRRWWDEAWASGNPTPRGRPRRSVRRSAVVTHAAFGVFGVFWGAWAAALPGVQENTGASKAGLGLALALVTVGAVPAMLLAGRTVDRYGALAVGGACAAFAVTSALPGLARSVPALALTLAVNGAASGAFDVVLNARASRLESESGLRVFPLAHAWYAVGVLVGAVSAGFARSAGAEPEGVLVVVSALLLVVAFALGGDSFAPAREEQPRLRLERLLLLLGVAGAACAIVEGGLESWSALFLERTLHARPAVSGLAPGFFGGAMAVGRFAGHAAHRFSDRTLFASGTLVAAAGLTIAAVAPNAPVALAGFAVGGVGISITAPLLFRTAGCGRTNPGSAIATMTVLTYSGFLLGPPIVGGTAEALSLRASFLVLAGLAAAVAVGTARFRFVESGT